MQRKKDMSIVDEIWTFLEGNMPDVTITQGIMPAAPDRCAMVRGTDLNSSGENGERVQILIRGDSSPSMALGDAQEVASLLDDFEGLLCADGHYVQRINIENGPAHLGVDQNRRQEYSINLRVFYCG